MRLGRALVRHYNFVDMKGQRVGPVTVGEEAPSMNGARWHWKCRCGREGVDLGIKLRDMLKRFNRGSRVGCGKDCTEPMKSKSKKPKEGIKRPKGPRGESAQASVASGRHIPSKEQERITDVCRECGVVTLEIPFQGCLCEKCKKTTPHHRNPYALPRGRGRPSPRAA